MEEEYSAASKPAPVMTQNKIKNLTKSITRPL